MKHFSLFLILFVLGLFGCQGKSGSPTTSSPSQTSAPLKTPEEVMKTISKMSLQDKTAVSDLDALLKEAHPLKVKVAALEKLSQISSEAATSALSRVWSQEKEDMLKQNALRALIKQNTDASRSVLKDVLQSSDKSAKILTLNLIGHYGKLQCKSLTELASEDKDHEIKTLSEKIQSKLKNK